MKKVITLMLSIVLLFLMIPNMKVQASSATNPKLVLSGYSLEENLVAGENTTLHLEFTNCSKTQSITEILITYTSANGSVMPIVGSSNQFYISVMAPEQTEYIDLPVMLYSDGNGYAQVNFTMLYTCGSLEEAKNVTNSSSIIFPLEGIGSLTITNANVARNTIVGAKTIASVSYKNDSRTAVYNAKLHLSGDVEEQTILLGMIGAGETGYSENYLIFDEPGTKNIYATLTFEDEEGNETVIPSVAYSIQVDEDKQEIQGTTNQPVVMQESQVTDDSVLMIIGLITVIVIILLVIAISGRRKR